jgi:dTDP-4-dehydrorhamnose reductase
MAENDRRPKVLVLGRGLLGQEIVQFLRDAGYAVDHIGRKPSPATDDFWDLARPNAFKLSSPYSHAVVAAGLTSFKACEQNERQSFWVNAVGRTAVVRELLDRGCHVTLLSSDAVFSGRTRVNTVGKTPDAQSVYGKHLAYAEESVIGMGGRATVLRLGKVMHSRLPILRDWTVRLSQGEVVRAFSDSVCAPISPGFASEAVGHVIAHDIAGRVNATSDVDMTWFEVAQSVARTVSVPISQVEEESCAGAWRDELCRRFSALPPTHPLPDSAPQGVSAVVSAVRSIMHEGGLQRT